LEAEVHSKKTRAARILDLARTTTGLKPGINADG
jgi:hypothetical protein